MSELHSPCPAECGRPLSGRDFENFYSQAQNGFNSILDAQSLYGNNLDWACLAQCDQEQYHIESWVEQGMTQPTTLPKQSTASDDIRDFPFLEGCEHFVATVMPIATGQNQWQLVAVVDSLEDQQNIGTQSVFNNYLDMLSLFIERDALLNTSTLRQRTHSNCYSNSRWSQTAQMMVFGTGI